MAYYTIHTYIGVVNTISSSDTPGTLALAHVRGIYPLNTGFHGASIEAPTNHRQAEQITPGKCANLTPSAINRRKS